MKSNNQPLAKPLRSQLENTVKSARDVAEKAALGHGGGQRLKGAVDFVIGPLVQHGGKAAGGFCADFDGVHDQDLRLFKAGEGAQLSPFAEGGGRHAIGFGEGAREAGEVGIAHPLCHLPQCKIALHQRNRSVVQADPPHGLRGGFTDDRPEQAVKVKPAESGHIGQRIQRQITCRMAVDMVDDPVQALFKI